jgi:hypothetical protein
LQYLSIYAIKDHQQQENSMKRATTAFETALIIVFTIAGLALMAHHYFTFN